MRHDFRHDGFIRLPDAVEPIGHETVFEFPADGLDGSRFRRRQRRKPGGIGRDELRKPIALGNAVAPQDPAIGEEPSAQKNFSGTFGKRDNADGRDGVGDGPYQVCDADLRGIEVIGKADDTAVPERADEGHVAATGDLVLGVEELKLKSGRRIAFDVGLKQGEIEGWRTAKPLGIAVPGQRVAGLIFPTHRVVAFVDETGREVELPLLDGNRVEIGTGEMEPLLHLAEGNGPGDDRSWLVCEGWLGGTTPTGGDKQDEGRNSKHVMRHVYFTPWRLPSAL